MARHLHQQAGGDPSQGPVREMANPTPSPEAGHDFPDTPPENRGSAGGDLSERQLADMADRMGLSRSASDGDTAAGAPAVSRSRWVAGLAGAVVVLAIITLIRRRS